MIPRRTPCNSVFVAIFWCIGLAMLRSLSYHRSSARGGAVLVNALVPSTRQRRTSNVLSAAASRRYTSLVPADTTVRWTRQQSAGTVPLSSLRTQPTRSSTRLLASSSSSSSDDNDNDSNGGFFSQEHADFAALGIQSPVLLERLRRELQLQRPTAVQAAAFADLVATTATTNNSNNDVTIGAETGSGACVNFVLVNDTWCLCCGCC